MFTCEPKPVPGLDGGTNERMIYIVCLVIASVFIFLIFSVYVLLWNVTNVHGWTMAAYSFSKLLSYILTSIVWYKAGISGFEPQLSTGCHVLAVLNRFFGMSDFCWYVANLK